MYRRQSRDPAKQGFRIPLAHDRGGITLAQHMRQRARRKHGFAEIGGREEED